MPAMMAPYLKPNFQIIKDIKIVELASNYRFKIKYTVQATSNISE